jgi:hypothetical protein
MLLIVQCYLCHRLNVISAIATMALCDSRKDVVAIPAMPSPAQMKQPTNISKKIKIWARKKKSDFSKNSGS